MTDPLRDDTQGIFHGLSRAANRQGYCPVARIWLA